MLQQKALTLKIDNRKLLAYNSPIIVDQVNARLTTSTPKTAVTLNLDNINGFSNGDFILISRIGDSIAEIRQIDQAPSAGSIHISTGTSFDHFQDTIITKIDYNQIEFSYSATETGTKTVLTTSSILPNFKTTDYQDSAPFTNKNYYYYRFKNSVSSAFSEYSIGIQYAGNLENSGYFICNKAVIDCGLKIGDKNATEPELVNDLQDAIDYIKNYGDWQFELYTDETSLTSESGQNKYSLNDLSRKPKYFGSKRGIQFMKFGNKTLTWRENDQMELIYESVITNTVSQNANIGDTSIFLQDTFEFGDEGTVLIGGNTITYTSNDTSTGELSGIPASGDGSITENIIIGQSAWQDITFREPALYTILGSDIILDTPVDVNQAGYKIKSRFLAEHPTITSLNDLINVPFYNQIKLFIQHKIELRKKDPSYTGLYLQLFDAQVAKSYEIYEMPILEEETYYNFSTRYRRTRSGDSELTN